MAPAGQWILLLDDDEIFRRLLSDLLTAHGYSTYEAGCCADADEALTHKEPMLAIVDYRLPDLDGIHWIARVREAGKKFPIIFLSNTWCDQQMFRQLHHILSVSLILQKPIEPNLFMEQIRGLLPAASSPEKLLAGVGDQTRSYEVPSSVYNLSQLRHSRHVTGALERAREAFARELPERIGRLAKTANSAKEGGERRDLIRDAIEEAHKLRGASGSFGYHDIGAMAAKIEVLLQSLESDDSTMQNILWSELNRHLAEMEGIALNEARAVGENPPSAAYAPESFGPKSYLQAASKISKATRENEHAPAPSELPVASPDGPKILALDDDPAITNFLETILNGEGMQVRTLQQPFRFFEVLEEFEPDAVLLDVIMPGVSGYDVCRTLRQHERWADLPVLFLTSRNDPEGRAFAFQAGGTDFLAKPILSRELVSRLKAHVEQAARFRQREEGQAASGFIDGASLVQHLEQSVGEARASRAPLLFCLIEVDNLDSLQKQYGLATEAVFGEVKRAIAGRFAGAQIKAQLASFFIVVLYGKTLEQGQTDLANLQAQMAGKRFATLLGGQFGCTVSFGMAELFRDTDNGADLLGIALDRLRAAQSAQAR